MKNLKFKNQNGKALLYVIIAIVIIAAIVGGYIFITSSNPQKVFVSQVNKTIDTYKNGLQQKQDKVNTTITLSGKAEAQENSAMQSSLQVLNDAKITLNVQADMNSKKSNVNLDVDYQNKKLLSGNIYYADGDENIYVFVKDLFDKYFKINLNTVIQDEAQREQIKDLLQGKATGVEKINVSKAAEILKNEITSKLQGKTFTKEKIDGLNKNTLKLTSIELTQMFKDIATNLKNNQDFLGCFEKSNDVASVLDSIISKLNKGNPSDKNVMEISIYTKGFLVQKIQKVEVKLMTGEEESGTITIQGVEKDKYELVMNIPNQGKITLNIEVKQDSNTTLDSVDVSNSVDTSALSQADMMTIYSNLSKMKIYSLISQNKPQEDS